MDHPHSFSAGASADGHSFVLTLRSKANPEIQSSMPASSGSAADNPVHYGTEPASTGGSLVLAHRPKTTSHIATSLSPDAAAATATTTSPVELSIPSRKLQVRRKNWPFLNDEDLGRFEMKLRATHKRLTESRDQVRESLGRYTTGPFSMKHGSVFVATPEAANMNRRRKRDSESDESGARKKRRFNDEFPDYSGLVRPQDTVSKIRRDMTEHVTNLRSQRVLESWAGSAAYRFPVESFVRPRRCPMTLSKVGTYPCACTGRPGVTPTETAAATPATNPSRNPRHKKRHGPNDFRMRPSLREDLGIDHFMPLRPCRALRDIFREEDEFFINETRPLREKN